MPNVYKTAQGKTINMDSLRLQNEKAVAVGNAAVNSRGDQVLPNGDIVKSKQEIMKDHYQPIKQNVTNNKR